MSARLVVIQSELIIKPSFELAFVNGFFAKRLFTEIYLVDSRIHTIEVWFHTFLVIEIQTALSFRISFRSSIFFLFLETAERYNNFPSNTDHPLDTYSLPFARALLRRHDRRINKALINKDTPARTPDFLSTLHEHWRLLRLLEKRFSSRKTASADAHSVQAST